MQPLPPAIMLLLRQGLEARKAGRIDAAFAAFNEVLRRQPDQPDALNLLAEMVQAQGRLADAETLLVHSLKANPRQAAAWNRLAAVQEDLGNLSGAETSLRHAAELEPGFAEAPYNRARVMREIGRPELAQRCLNQAFRLPSRVPLLRAQMLQLRAPLQEDEGQLDAALATLDEALTVAPQRAALHHNRGTLLQRLSRPLQALAAHDTAMGLGLDVADAHYNRGNSLQSLGRTADALAAYRNALARDPQHALALYDIARLRWRLGDPDFSADLDAAMAAAPQSPVAPGIKGRLLLRAERHAEAADAYARAAALERRVAGYPDGLGQALARLGRFDEALAAHRRAVDLAPRAAATHISHAGTLLLAGRVADALQAADTAVQLDPADQQAWALRGLAWRAAGDPREAWLNDYATQVQVFDLEAPPGWADMAAFNRALAAELAQQHTDAEAPIDQTLRHGSQTLGDIFEQGLPLVTQLRQCIAQAVDRYVAGLRLLPADAEHPLTSRLAPRWRFTDSWSSRLRHGGFHTAHVHPHGWISSCYYVALPPAITAPADQGEGGAPGAGWITFGSPDFQAPGIDFSARRAVRPQVGRLVLFPSYMWHGTVPFDDEQPRLTVAFDVMPLG